MADISGPQPPPPFCSVCVCIYIYICVCVCVCDNQLGIFYMHHPTTEQYIPRPLLHQLWSTGWNTNKLNGSMTYSLRIPHTVAEQRGGGGEGANFARKCNSTTPIGAPIYIWLRAAIPPCSATVHTSGEAGRKSILECPLVVRWVVASIPLGGPNYRSSQCSTTGIAKAVACSILSVRWCI